MWKPMNLDDFTTRNILIFARMILVLAWLVDTFLTQPSM